MTAKVIPLGAPGQQRYFAPAAETTARHDGWMMVQIHDAGVMKFISKELDEASAYALVAEVYRSGKWEYLLAGALVEQGTPWTPENAVVNAEWFAGLTDPASKRALQEAFIPALAGFFLRAMPSSAPSPSVLETNGTTATASRRKPRKRANGAAPSTEAGDLVPAGSGSDARGS
jgi:hypothetical protein